jgi:hypothetical protein
VPLAPQDQLVQPVPRATLARREQKAIQALLGRKACLELLVLKGQQGRKATQGRKAQPALLVPQVQQDRRGQRV